MLIIYVAIAIVVFLITYFWVSAIENIHKKYPDYKGNQDGFDFDDDISDWDTTLMDGLDDDEIIPIYKFNNGNGAMLCNKCSRIISTGPKTDVLYCDKCKK